MAKRRSTFPVVRWLLIACALSFVLVQIRMLMIGTECSDRVKVLMEAQRKWANEARSLRKNLTDVTRETMGWRRSWRRPRRRTSTPGKEDTQRKQQQQQQQQQHVVATSTDPLDKQGGGEGQTGAGVTRGGGIRGGKMLGGGVVQAARAGRMRGGGDAKDAVAAVVIMACNRVDYLDRTIQSVLLHHKGLDTKVSPLHFPGRHECRSQGEGQAGPTVHLPAAHRGSTPRMNNPGENIAYYRIAEHYKFALTELFDRRQFPRVIILEDDMELAPDFFDYFEATSNLLDVDESILAVSSWNDNGQKQFVHDSELLYRSDFFPGLGWMLKRELWAELKPKWARAYWDDWLRLPEQRKGRQTIRPEVCRTYNFGEHGSSMGQYFSQYLAPIRLNALPVNWAQKDLSYLLDVSYPAYMVSQLRTARLIPLAAVNTEW
ncbi:hypothetical protein CLOM_g6318 [Closterium sp. NIES-68]|nr:hypothetical protein CLOM_g6318 [Closterium sp. NIES-68]